MKRRSVLRCSGKMHFLQIVILSLSISVYQVLSQTNIDVANNEYSDQHSWSLVYSMHPYFNSEMLLEVWRTNKNADVSTNAVTTARSDQQQTILYSEDNQRNNTTLQEQNNASYLLSETKNTSEPNDEEQLSKNRRLSNYRNRRKDAILQRK